MKISILGTNGFLSTAIAKYANEQGWFLSAYGLTEPIGYECDEFYKVNLLDTTIEVSRLLDEEVIIYAIGAGIQSNIKESADSIYTLNVLRPVLICNKLNELEYKGKFVTFGSYFELGDYSRQTPATEYDILRADALSPTRYVSSKRMLTRYISSYKHTFTHWHFILPTIYGVGENPNRLIPYTVNSIRTSEPMHFTSGEQIRQYIHVSEVAKILSLSISKELPSGIYNIAGKEILSVRQLVTQIFRSQHTTMPTNCFGDISRNDLSMRYLALDGEKLHHWLDYTDKSSLLQHINDY